MSNKNKTIDLNRTYFTMIEVAHLLSVEKQTIRNYITRGIIDSIKVGGVVRIHRDELIKHGVKLG